MTRARDPRVTELLATGPGPILVASTPADDRPPLHVPIGATRVRIRVTERELGQAMRGLMAHAADLGLDNGPRPSARPRRARTKTPVTLVESSPSTAECTADAWRRCYERSLHR